MQIKTTFAKWLSLILITQSQIACSAESSPNIEPYFATSANNQTLASVLPHRDRAEPMQRIVEHRLNHLLPKLMKESGLDMWLVINREYMEDPLYFSLVPATTFAARRTTILVFTLEDDQVIKTTVSRYDIGDLYKSIWQGGDDASQWARLAEYIAEKDPQKIGVNTSKDWPMADGLTAGLKSKLDSALPEKYRNRLVSAEKMAIRWLETRTDLEIALYPHIVAIARSVIAEAFSTKTITPGATTTDDLSWAIRNKFEDLQVKPWFHPYVTVQRKGDKNELDAPFFGKSNRVIQPGDLIHTDVGICYLKLCTDTQEMGYILKLGESDIPDGFKQALKIGNQWQDILTGEFKTGLTGNQILANTQEKSKKADIKSATYTHPIGFVGHAHGPTIGMWDNQGPTPIHGDWPLYPNTAYAIEGNVKVQVPEWDNQWVQIMMEQSALYDGNKVHYLASRQTRWHLIR